MGTLRRTRNGNVYDLSIRPRRKGQGFRYFATIGGRTYNATTKRELSTLGNRYAVSKRARLRLI